MDGLSANAPSQVGDDPAQSPTATGSWGQRRTGNHGRAGAHGRVPGRRRDGDRRRGAGITSGLPAFIVVGLPDKAIGESRERVRAALASIGLALPLRHITVNLAPADVVKEGSHFDLPIALGLLISMGVVPAPDAVAGHTVLGELSLDGGINRVDGVLAAAIASSASGRAVICPAACGGEAAWAAGIRVLAPPSLLSFINHVKGTQVLGAPEPALEMTDGPLPDLRDIKGQETAKRALEVAGRRRAQPADGRPAGRRQVDAGGKAARVCCRRSSRPRRWRSA